MKPFIIIFFALIFSGCVQKQEAIGNSENTKVLIEKAIVIDNVLVAKSQLFLDQNQGTWYYNNKPFNGFSVKSYANGTLEEKLGYHNGKREGVARRWSENEVLRVESFYSQNKLVGTYRNWWENGVLSEESNYENGVKQGVEKQWYPNEQLAKFRNLVDGDESGMQQAWLETGALYVNYEAKNGRIFGLLRSNLCYQLENEVVVKN
jgi:antitoxin component YwqK of YwqJK toxin-antitoxin module